MDQRDIKSDPGSQTLPHPGEGKKEKQRRAGSGRLCQGGSCVQPDQPTPFYSVYTANMKGLTLITTRVIIIIYTRDCQPPRSRAGD